MSTINQNKWRREKGFSLFELALVLLVMTMGSLYAIHAFNRDQQREDAAAVGEQVRTVADAVNGYIVNNYAALIASPTTAVTVADLRTATLLPASFSDTNIQGSGWSISLRRTGASPNWNIEGLVLLNNPVTDGLTPNLSLSGHALRAIGADGGMSYDGLSISGMEGAWVAAQAQYPAITQVGQVGARVGYGTSQFTQFLRRDGTLPMTGSLNMGGQSINSAQNITAAGTVTAATTTTGALNASGASTLTGAVTMGGHASMSTGEVRLVVGENTSCAGYNSGAFAKDSTGVLLSCQGGTWKKAAGAGGSGTSYKAFIERHNGKTLNLLMSIPAPWWWVPTRSYPHVAQIVFCASCGSYGALQVYLHSHGWPFYGNWYFAGTLYPEGGYVTYTPYDIYFNYYGAVRIHARDNYGYYYPMDFSISMTPYSVTISLRNMDGNCGKFESHTFISEEIDSNLLNKYVPLPAQCNDPGDPSD